MPKRLILKFWSSISFVIFIGTPILFAPFAYGTVVEQIKISQDSAKSAFAPRRLVLMVGVNEFQDFRFRGLKYPQKDVGDFSDFLRDHNAQAHDYVVSVLGKAATVDSVIEALNDLERKNTSPQDIVLVYLSTHGTLAYEHGSRLKRYAVLNDTRFDRAAETGLSLDYIQNRLARFKSDRKALILALCHSGTGKSHLPSTLDGELASMKGEFFVEPLHQVSTAMMVLSASAWGQPAREDETLANDIYTHFLLQGLKQHDANRDGGISLFEAHEFARTRTYDFTKGQQTPSALLNVSGTDPIVLNGAIERSAGPLLFADSERFRNVRVLVNGQSKGTLWNPQNLPPGRVKLTLLDPKNPQTPLLDNHVYLRKRESYPVSQLFARKPSIGIELGAENVPLPVGFEGFSGAELWAPSVGVAFAEVLGTRWQSELRFLTLSHDNQVDVEGVATTQRFQMHQARTGAGLAFYPSASMRMTVTGGLGYLRVKRNIDNEAFHKAVQQGEVTFPYLASSMKLLNVLGRSYVGVDIVALPLRGQGLMIDRQLHPLRSFSGGGYLGYLF